MAQTLLAPVTSSAASKQHVSQRFLPAASASLPVRQRPLQAQSPWQHTVDPAFGSSSLLDVSLVDRDNTGLWSLNTLGVTLEQEQHLRQKQDYYLNYGRALRAIREDIPRFFKQAPDTSILAENVSFVDHIGPRIGLRASTVEGKKAYSQHMWLLRFHSSLFFSRCEVSIQRVWERDSRTVVVRWNLRCFPRILDNVMGTLVNLDGLSEYHFNDAGFVQMHKVDVINWEDALSKKPARQLYRSLSTAGC